MASRRRRAISKTANANPPQSPISVRRERDEISPIIGDAQVSSLIFVARKPRACAIERTDANLRVTGGQRSS